MQPAHKPAGPPPDDEPFRYGWREVHVARPDGTLDLERLPLTLEDLLHPEEGDHALHSLAHDLDCS
jgi:hypothetical protein